MSWFATRSPDGRAEHEIVRDLVAARGLEPGDVIAYEDLHEALDRPGGERHAVQQAVRIASRRMLADEKRCLVPVRGKGYKIAHPSEHVAVGKDREVRGVRQFARAVQVYDQTPLDELTPAQRELHLRTSMLAHEAFAVLGDHERRLRKIERLIGSVAGPKVVDVDPDTGEIR